MNRKTFLRKIVIFAVLIFGFAALDPSPLGNVSVWAQTTECRLIIDTNSFEELGNGEYRIIPGYSDTSVLYRTGNGKWMEVRTELEEETKGSYILPLTMQDTVSIKVVLSKEVPFWNASFGIENANPQNFGPVSAPRDFDQSGFFADITSENGYTFTAGQAGTYRLAINLGTLKAPEVHYKYFLDFSKYGKVAADGSKVTFDVSGKKVGVTLKGGSFTNGGAGIPEDLSAAVFVLDQAFDASSMSVYIQETGRESHPFTVDLWVAKGTNEVTLAKSDIGNGHWPDKMSFVIGKGKTKTYTPESSGTNKTETETQKNITSFVIKTGRDGTASLVSYENPGSSLTVPSIVSAGRNYYSITAIGKAALAGDKKIKKLVIPKAVKTIGKNAFKDCNALKTIIITADSNIKTGDGAFEGLAAGSTVKIKASKKIFKKIRARILSAGADEQTKFSRK